MNWKAIGLGVAVGIGGTLLLGVVFSLFPLDATQRPMWAIMLLSYAAGGVVDVATGATAGWVAARRGAAHGVLSGFIANLVSPLLGFGMMLLRFGAADAPIGLGSYLVAVLPGSVLGVLLALLGGIAAVALGRTRSAGAH